MSDFNKLPTFNMERSPKDMAMLREFNVCHRNYGPVPIKPVMNAPPLNPTYPVHLGVHPSQQMNQLPEKNLANVNDGYGTANGCGCKAIPLPYMPSPNVGMWNLQPYPMNPLFSEYPRF